MLRVSGLRKQFGGLVAVREVGFTARPGEVLGLIGPNGAGKTTVFNLISGVLRPDRGEIRYRDRLLNGLKMHEIAALGIRRTFQNLELFTNLTVAENVMVGGYGGNGVGFTRSLFRRPGPLEQERILRAKAMALLARLGLADRADSPAGSLPFGQQRLLEIARALAGKPKVLLLDEPAAGLNHAESRELAVFMRSLAEAGHAVVLVEHDMETVMGVADRMVVLNFGAVIATGTPAEIRAHPAVIEAYLGREEDGD